MISRCPSCAAEVSDEAARCPSCHWDFAAFKRIPPGQTPPPRPVEKPKPAEPPKPVERPKPVELPKPAPSPKPVELPKAEAPKAVEIPKPKELPVKLSPPPPPPPEPSKEAPDIPLTQIRRLPERPQVKPVPQKIETAKKPPQKIESQTLIRHPRPKSAGPMPLVWGAMALLGLTAVGVGVMYFLTRPEGSPPTAEKAEAPVFEKRTEPSALPAQAPPPAPAAAPRIPAAALAPAAPPKISELPPAAKAAPAWVFEGKVYDIMSLAPVYGAQIVFKDAQGSERGEAGTDSRGRYRVSLDPLTRGGYRLSISHPDYKNAYLDEISPPYASLDLGQRKALAAAKVYNPPWKGNNAKPIRRDFVLIPNE